MGSERVVEARRRATGKKRTAEQKQGKQVCFAGEEQPVEKRAQSTDEQDVMDGLEEVRTGRDSAGREADRCQTDETSRKGKGKGNGSKEEHGKKGGEDSKAKEQRRVRCRQMMKMRRK